jgi:DNA-binding NtrC family response regulator
MNTVRVLVISPRPGLRELLAGALPGDRFRVAEVRPGRRVPEVVRSEQPHVAVIDAIHDRPATAELEVAILKELVPGAQIVVLSEQSSAQDGHILEQGIFYYLAARSGSELVRIVEAAGCARALTEQAPMGAYPT